MTLDSMSYIFQNLNGVREDIALEFDDNGDAQVANIPYNTHPLIIHGNGPSKLFLNHLANYIGKAWSAQRGCLFCETSNYVNLEVENFIDRSTNRYHSIRADNMLVDLDERRARRLAVGILAPLVVQQDRLFSNFWGALSSNGYYSRSDDYVEIVERRRIGLWNVPFINSVFFIRNSKFDSIKDAFSYNLQLDPDMSFCEFARHSFDSIKDAFSYNLQLDPDMSFCEFARHSGHFMYVDNRNYYGFLVASDDFDTTKLHPEMYQIFDNPDGHFMYVDNRNYYGFLVVSDDFDTTKLHPEMYQIFDNPDLWESRYIHEKYFHARDGRIAIDEPCQDVFDFPLMSEAFCSELIEEMEHYGQWSSGKNQVEVLSLTTSSIIRSSEQICYTNQFLYWS
uniref:Radical SAM protein n=1 Tax=Ascaris lumbricoides TaxID=6252 RepID=A0A0M3ISG0_ASCLU